MELPDGAVVAPVEERWKWKCQAGETGRTKRLLVELVGVTEQDTEDGLRWITVVQSPVASPFTRLSGSHSAAFFFFLKIIRWAWREILLNGSNRIYCICG